MGGGGREKEKQKKPFKSPLVPVPVLVKSLPPLCAINLAPFFVQVLTGNEAQQGAEKIIEEGGIQVLNKSKHKLCLSISSFI